MTVFVGLLRAVNVGGTGMLPMKDLAALCTGLGLENVRTYIQSGNVVFESGLSEEEVTAALEKALAERMGRRVDVMCRSAAELRAVLEGNPFPEGKPSQVQVVFLPAPVSEGELERLSANAVREEIRPAGREIYIYYPDGMGRSKLRSPSGTGTARNINTVARLVAMAEG